MSCNETGFKEINGQNIYYRVSGDGPPLVFVHGWSANLTDWDAQVALFSRKYRTYSYDWRGMGKSSGAKPAFSMKELGEELAGLIDAFEIEKPIICGHSEGGAITMRYAAMHPDSVAALILADTALNTTTAAIQQIFGLALIELFVIFEHLEGHNPLEKLVPTMQKAFFSQDFIDTNPDFIAAWQKQFVSNSVAGVVNGMRAWAWRPDIHKQLNKVKAPTLLLWGMKDVVIKLEQMQYIQENLLLGSKLATIQGAGHATPVETPDQFNELMDTFLDSVFSVT